jgi:hypothetical protein
MNNKLSDEGLDLLFRNARSHNGWLPDPMSGPMSGFDNKKVDDAFFAGTTWKSNFICGLGIGDAAKLHPRGPRLDFGEACKII